MTRRKAKKRVKAKWRLYGLKHWPGNMTPRQVDLIYSTLISEFSAALAKALDDAILYGSKAVLGTCQSLLNFCEELPYGY